MEPISEVHLMNNIKFLQSKPDGYFDLIVDDPPFGIGCTWKKSTSDNFYNETISYSNDRIPPKRYFGLLRMKSRNQIIWGGNYYTKYLPVTNSWIVWDKVHSDKNPMSDCELAWTSFKKPMRIVRLLWDGARKCETTNKIHPHQKPIKLYQHCLNYAKILYPGARMFDGHVGSGSSRIAAYDAGLDYYGTEIDKTIYDAQEKRFKKHKSQLSISYNYHL